MEGFSQQLLKKCLLQLKQRLKAKHITYQQLANHFATSEVTIKRLLNNPKIHFTKLVELCEICELSITELLASAENEPTQHHFFTDSQDLAFAKHRCLLTYFSRLFYQNQSTEEIAMEFELDELSTYQYLSELERIGLISLTAKKRIKFLVAAPLGFARNSLVIRQQITDILQQTCQTMLDNDSTQLPFFFIKPLYLSEELYRRLLQDIQNLISRYAEISELAAEHYQDKPYFQIAVGAHQQATEIVESIPCLTANYFK